MVYFPCKSADNQAYFKKANGICTMSVDKDNP